jgi:hypothetical protein
MEVTGRQLHAPATLPPENQPSAPIGWEAGWAPELLWMLWRSEKSLPAGNQTQDIQPVAHQFFFYLHYFLVNMFHFLVPRKLY